MLLPKLCVPIAYRPQGGMYSFVASFLEYLRSHGAPHTQDIDDQYDVLFVNSWVVPFDTVHRVRTARPVVRIVQRVDGAARDYGRFDDADWKQARVNLLADLTIFQSEYSRFSAREKFRVIAQDGPVIYNPVNVDRFNPVGPTLPLPPARIRVASAAWSTNRMKGTWQIDRLAAELPEIEFVLCGRFVDVSDRPNVRRLGHLTHDQMASALRSCDMFLNLSENDPCPNVVLEALASGLPVVYKPSGGVPELVGEAGVPIGEAGIHEALEEAMTHRHELGRAGRERAVLHFAPEVIFPQYLDVIASARRRARPNRWRALALAPRGYPVLPRLSTVSRDLAARLYRRSPYAVQSLVDRARGRRPVATWATRKSFRVGWVTADSFPGGKTRLSELEPFTRMRTGHVAEWINRHSEVFHNELYRIGASYDVVVFQKMMDERCQAEAQGIQANGGKVVFDANVNYYEIWGDYFVPGTRPTETQQRDAVAMTRLADWVVADSRYLAAIVENINPHVTWIPDNVNLEVYGRIRRHRPKEPLTLVWSGVAKKAAHLLSIREVLGQLAGMRLVLVCDTVPDVLDTLQDCLPCRVVRFSDRAYARVLGQSDILVSPKRLANGYEMAHTEYKIALGMAAGLPVVASPQPSYVEAITHGGGGIIAANAREWYDGLMRLAADPILRAEIGARGRGTVEHGYSTPVVARRYLDVLTALIGPGRVVAESDQIVPVPNAERV